MNECCTSTTILTGNWVVALGWQNSALNIFWAKRMGYASRSLQNRQSQHGLVQQRRHGRWDSVSHIQPMLCQSWWSFELPPCASLSWHKDYWYIWCSIMNRWHKYDTLILLAINMILGTGQQLTQRLESEGTRHAWCTPIPHPQDMVKCLKMKGRVYPLIINVSVTWVWSAELEPADELVSTGIQRATQQRCWKQTLTCTSAVASMPGTSASSPRHWTGRLVVSSLSIAYGVP